ncbi:MAG: AAA family ATPase [Pyrinomonadaceae bacterium]
MSFEDEGLETEEELRESYPHLYGGTEEPYEPPPYKLTAEQEAFRATERAKLLARRVVAEEHGEDYHNLEAVSAEELPALNFRRYDNLFLARPAKAFLNAAKGKPKSERRLFGDFWLEGEITVLFGETGCGKSVLAMQIARALAGGERFEPFEMDVEPGRVTYFDFELTDDQFAKRYTSDVPTPGEESPFPIDLIRCPPQVLRSLPPGFDSYHDFLIGSITHLVEYLGAKFIVLDNITWLSPNLEASPTAQRLMKTLVQLRNELGVSILVLAHTQKRFSRTPIEVAHLNGSKMLSVFVDSMFALGTSRRGKRLRYIKSIKHRNAPDREAEVEVATVRIGKEANFLGFTYVDLTDERSHIGWSYGHSLEAEFMVRVEQLAEGKLTQRAIAKELGVGSTTIHRCLKALKKKEAGEDL